VVFYDGRSPWTAALNFTGRIVMPEALRRYIPSFEYCLVELNRYKIDDLLRFKDELAALMLIDKVDFRDKGELLRRFPQYVEAMALKIPEGLVTLMDASPGARGSVLTETGRHDGSPDKGRCTEQRYQGVEA
jgi:hypothetical protein